MHGILFSSSAGDGQVYTCQMAGLFHSQLSHIIFLNNFYVYSMRFKNIYRVISLVHRLIHSTSSLNVIYYCNHMQKIRNREYKLVCLLKWLDLPSVLICLGLYR